METAVRDAATAVTILNGLVLLARKRDLPSVGLCIFLVALCWFALFSQGAHGISISLPFLLVFGYLLLSNTGVIGAQLREKWNRNIVQAVLGREAAARWDSGVARMRRRQQQAEERQVNVVTILEEERIHERRQNGGHE